MPNWKAWPAAATAAKFKLHLFVHELTGLQAQSLRFSHSGGVALQVEWRGNRQKAENLLKGTRSNCTTRQIPAQHNGVISWNEGFDNPCRLKMSRSGRFKSWIVKFEIHGFTSRWIDAFTVLGKAKIDVSEYASDKGKSLKIPIACNINGVSKDAELTVTIELLDVERKERSLSPIIQALSFKFSNSRKEFRRNFSSIYTNNHNQSSGLDTSSEDEYRRGTNRRTSKSNDEGPERRNFLSRILSRKKSLSFSSAISNHSRKETPPNHTPPSLLQEENRSDVSVADDDSSGNNNVDDQIPSNQQQQQQKQKQKQKQHDFFPVSEIDDCFEVGNWERKGVISRDGNMELVTDVFFASIDQCSERADGGGACAVLVAVIADWLHKNRKTLPLRSQFDELIREGSSEWRKLCEKEDNSERFSDLHFDLETVLRSKVRHIEVETYVSFFSIAPTPDNLEYFSKTMPFDKIWDDIIVNSTCQDSDVEKIFVVSWNDHFFVLKVEKDEIFLIDTLGERLHEGCNQAYVLKFSNESVIYRLQKQQQEQQQQQQQQQQKEQEQQQQQTDNVDDIDQRANDATCSRYVACEGVASCKEFIKGFLAAVPLRELQEDMERGSLERGHLHRRLQVEFHRTIPML